MQEIKSLRHKRIIEEEQNAALSLAETFASNISKGKEKLEIERKLQLEERQMRNMETLVSAVSHNHSVRTNNTSSARSDGFNHPSQRQHGTNIQPNQRQARFVASLEPETNEHKA